MRDRSVPSRRRCVVPLVGAGKHHRMRFVARTDGVRTGGRRAHRSEADRHRDQHVRAYKFAAEHLLFLAAALIAWAAWWTPRMQPEMVCCDHFFCRSMAANLLTAARPECDALHARTMLAAVYGLVYSVKGNRPRSSRCKGRSPDDSSGHEETNDGFHSVGTPRGDFFPCRKVQLHRGRPRVGLLRERLVGSDSLGIGHGPQARDVLAGLEAEIAEIRASAVRAGWTTWTLIGSLAAVLWLFLDKVATPLSASHVAIVAIGVAAAFDWLAFLTSILAGTVAKAPRLPKRFRSLHRAPWRVRALLLLLSAQSFLIAGGVIRYVCDIPRWGWVTTASYFGLRGVVGLVTFIAMFMRYPVPVRPSPKQWRQSIRLACCSPPPSASHVSVA